MIHLLRLFDAADHIIEERIPLRCQQHTDYRPMLAGSQGFSGRIRRIAKLLRHMMYKLFCLRLHIAASVQHAVHRAPGYPAELGNRLNRNHSITRSNFQSFFQIFFSF